MVGGPGVVGLGDLDLAAAGGLAFRVFGERPVGVSSFKVGPRR
jgi:hypothetical protein